MLQDIDLSYLSPDESFLSARLPFSAIDAVKMSLTSGRSFNINPAKAREADDLLRTPAIWPDGSGLSSTLHGLQVAESQSPNERLIRYRRLPKDGMETVLSWTRLVYPTLEGIRVVQDPHTGKYSATVSLNENGGLKLPIQMLSDGTIKWLSLVCLLVTSGGAYSLEEPENFLHPRMQQFLIKIVRETLESDRRGGYFIVSTHSETVINCCSPDELILFDFQGGATHCWRIEDPDHVKEEINSSGFGLGYYYASESLF